MPARAARAGREVGDFAPLLAGVRELGPVATLVVAVALGLVCAVLLVRWTRDLLDQARAAAQSTAFQDRLLKAVEALTASETALRERLDELADENATLREQTDEMRETLAQIRGQRRRLIGYLQDVQAGRLAPAAIPPPELVGT